MATPRRRRRTQQGPPPPNHHHTIQPIPVHTLSTTATQHLPPLPLVVTVLLCSGFFWMSSFRDAMATGKPILDRLGLLWGQDNADEHWLQYTKSTNWYKDNTNHGWKSKQGGLSTILPITTDANNMGGLFVRKLSGVTGMSFQLAKLWPIVLPSSSSSTNQSMVVGPSWMGGHYDPLLVCGMIGDAALAFFYSIHFDEWKNAGSDRLGMVYILAGSLEAVVFGLYLIQRRRWCRRHPIHEKKVVVPTPTHPDHPHALPSRIVARTVLLVSSFLLLTSLRDLFFPGTILSFLPRDDIYLEWTGAFLHSPPPNTVEFDLHGLEAPLYTGDKFLSQLLGLHLSLCCMLKIVSAIGWKKGTRSMGGTVPNVDRWGVVASKLIWKTQALGDMLLLILLRMFTPAAQTASLDLRWHLMMVAYEMMILGLYAFW